MVDPPRGVGACGLRRSPPLPGEKKKGRGGTLGAFLTLASCARTRYLSSVHPLAMSQTPGRRKFCAWATAFSESSPGRHARAIRDEEVAADAASDVTRLSPSGYQL